MVGQLLTTPAVIGPVLIIVLFGLLTAVTKAHEMLKRRRNRRWVRTLAASARLGRNHELMHPPERVTVVIPADMASVVARRNVAAQRESIRGDQT